MKTYEANQNLITVTNLRKGEEGVIVELNTKNSNTLRKLMAMGIMPGMTLKMIQTFPSYVFQVGYTQVAVDKEIASVIIIDK